MIEIFRADVLIDGTGSEPQRNVDIVVENGVIQDVRPAGTGQTPPDARIYTNPGRTVLPGFIDVHVHLMFGTGRRSYEDVVQHDSDDLMILRGTRNAYLHLRAGVTTMRDCGARNKIGFALREGARAGLFLSPRMHVCGRPLTITGGHFWWCNEEADGVDGVRAATRKLLKEGADFIKIMAAGGGTVGTYAQFPTYEVEELRAAINEAHKIGKPASCHCIATESIVRALDAGTDHIEHCSFMAPDKSWVYDGEIAQRVAEAGVMVTPTLQVGADRYLFLEERVRSGAATPAERQDYEAAQANRWNAVANARNLHELGVPLVAGNDAGWRHTGFDDFYEELQYLVEAGLTPVEAIHAATGLAARACRIDQTVGTLAQGMIADLIAVSGDPASDVGTLKDPALVLQSGRVVVDRR